MSSRLHRRFSEEGTEGAFHNKIVLAHVCRNFAVDLQWETISVIFRVDTAHHRFWWVGCLLVQLLLFFRSTPSVPSTAWPSALAGGR